MTRDEKTVRSFGEEWTRFDQGPRSEADLRQTFERYFALFPWDRLPPSPVGADIGCGSGRWARFVAPRVRRLLCIDPSAQALEVARRNVASSSAGSARSVFVVGAAGELPVADRSLDFAYSLGVLHHTPDPAGAMSDCVKKLKPGAPFLVYLYYAFDNRPGWFRKLWRVSELVRRLVSQLPRRPRQWLADLLALVVYLPLARTARLFARMGVNVEGFPLSLYRDKPWYVLRNDALDRFGTPVEHRFTAAEIRHLMENAGLRQVTVATTAPFWCALGYRTGPAAAVSGSEL